LEILEILEIFVFLVIIRAQRRRKLQVFDYHLWSHLEWISLWKHGGRYFKQEYNKSILFSFDITSRSSLIFQLCKKNVPSALTLIYQKGAPGQVKIMGHKCWRGSAVLMMVIIPGINTGILKSCFQLKMAFSKTYWLYLDKSYLVTMVFAHTNIRRVFFWFFLNDFIALRQRVRLPTDGSTAPWFDPGSLHNFFLQFFFFFFKTCVGSSVNSWIYRYR
jgi:hypothetical protein